MSRMRFSKSMFQRRFHRRLLVVGVVFAAAFLVLLGRAVQLQLLDQEFLARQGDARHLRVAPIAAHRGMITIVMVSRWQ